MKNMSIPAVMATPAQVTNNWGQNLSGFQIWLHIRIIRGQTTEAKKKKIYIYIHIHFRLEGGRVERLLSSPHLTGIPKLQLASQWYSGKESACQWWRNKRCGFDPWIGRPPGEGSRNPLQYSCLGNSMDRGAWRVQSLGSQSIGHD